MVARCHWGISLQVVKRIVRVGCRSLWVANGAAVLLGNVIAGFHGSTVLLGNAVEGFHCGAVLLGNALEGFHGGAVFLGNVVAGGQTHCNGRLQFALGCKWCRGVIRESN